MIREPHGWQDEPTADFPEQPLLSPDLAARVRAALDDLDRYAAGMPADLTKELRALLRLPRSTP